MTDTKASKFVRQPAVIARTAEHYYVLRSHGVVDMGGGNRAALEKWARSHGFAPTFVDERRSVLRADGDL